MPSKNEIFLGEIVTYYERNKNQGQIFNEFRKELIGTNTIGQETIVLMKVLDTLNATKKHLLYFTNEIRLRINYNKKIQRPSKKAIKKLQQQKNTLDVGDL